MLHIKRHVEEMPDYIEVKDSRSLQRFGEQHMSVPGARAKLDRRVFIDIGPEEFKERKKVVGKAATLAGIQSKYEYVAFPSGQVCDNFLSRKC